MLIKAIEVGYLQTNCYIVADEATLDAAVIDPGADSNLILDYIERCHFHVRAILLTHGHFDHCMGLEEVHDATGATVYMSHADLTTDIGNGMFGNEDFELDPPDDTVFVREGDVIEAGSLSFDVLETPGHTPGGRSPGRKIRCTSRKTISRQQAKARAPPPVCTIHEIWFVSSFIDPRDEAYRG